MAKGVLDVKDNDDSTYKENLTKIDGTSAIFESTNEKEKEIQTDILNTCMTPILASEQPQVNLFLITKTNYSLI